MKLAAYSSLTAFLAHCAALRDSSSPDDRATRDALDAVLAELGDADRAALNLAPPLAGAAARHRARAELNLRRLLAAHGLLAG